MASERPLTKNLMKPWNLNDSNFSFLDRLKICKFFLNPKNFWTMNKQVSLFEKKMGNYVGSKYSVFVSSGSSANTILAMYLRDQDTKKRKIVFPSTTWTTSISPFIREGFEPVFLDISLKDFSIDLDKLERFLNDSSSEDIACVFVTSLIGFVPDMERLLAIEKKFNVRIMMDNCENMFGKFDGKNVSSFFTSTASTYFGHQIQSVEGGFIFTNSKQEYDYFLMARNHGMVRSVKDREQYRNKDVDASFDFYSLGNNFRNTDINAFIGLLDFRRIDRLKQKREDLFSLFNQELETKSPYRALKEIKKEHSPFCIPILCDSKEMLQNLKAHCLAYGIETRPIISGNLLKQTCYRKYGNPLDFPNSELLHNLGFYVGLHFNVDKNNVKNLAHKINKIKKK